MGVAWSSTDSPIGPLLVAVTGHGLVRLAFQNERVDAVLDELRARVDPALEESAAGTEVVRQQLDEYFAGDRRAFDLPLDWQLSTGFRRLVLERLHADVGYGQTVSYLDLARMVGNPSATRAVGTAMATNPIPIVVPCHRVVASGGELGGFGGGLAAKRTLLALETGARPLF